MVDFMTWEEENGHTFKKKKLKYIVSTPITDGPHETPELLDEGIPFLSAESVKNGILDFNYKRGYISLSDHKLFCKKVRPQKNDIFIVKSGATTGNCGIVTTDEEFSIWSPLALIRCDNISVLQKFIYYYSLCYSFTHQVEQSWSYGTQQNIGMGVLGNLYVTLPSSNEQQSIVDYLDKECAQIDSIAADLEKQIALLQQYKKSLITETVTKGLDKSVPMKDSGVEWIGKIPEHWDVEPIKYRVTFHNGDRGENYPSKSELQSEGIPFINAGHLEGDGLNMDNMDYISEEKYRIMGGVKLRPGDILYCLRGSVGKNAIVDMNQGTVASSLVAIRSVRILAEYLYYCLNSHIEEVQRYLWDNGTAQPNLSADNLGKYKFCIPPVEEQKAIVKYLNNICSQIDNLVIGKKKQLSTIQQHKKSLIYEYVTGKKRVKEVR
ncbi:restriction endonuclease subunit S [Clostridium sp. M62/1]|uniref:restriction endonuclease subunit S n=1 Tax=Clostridium sp. M62/1 TaxID=411486 RepID=UPI0001973978|nr:restriction endonuclease subunit S [Clostridium sp. M62/1]EFE13684.1 type I restriction modification DNA specificity domain protein [Clostridium sp. M62/1]UEB80204.1 restriction endonuclease subunit S [Clostridium sp. M62/1]